METYYWSNEIDYFHIELIIFSAQYKLDIVLSDCSMQHLVNIYFRMIQKVPENKNKNRWLYYFKIVKSSPHSSKFYKLSE